MPARDDRDNRFGILQALLATPCGGMQHALNHAADVVARALNADKVDAFLYDETRDSMVAVGTSDQPLSQLQRRLGLDVLPLSNGGRVVEVFKTGETHATGDLLHDEDELLGIKEGLRVQSQVGAAIEVGERRMGMLMVASLERDFFTREDFDIVQATARWVGVVAHRAELIEQRERDALALGRRKVADELVTMVAHDLRNYLAPVSLRLYKLRQRAERDSRPADLEDAVAALGGIAQLTGLLANLLDSARLEEGAYRMHVGPVDAAAMIEDAVRMLSAGERRIVVNASASVVVAADPLRIRQCVDNLLVNAVKHSPATATVHAIIALEHDGESHWGRIDIVDEGDGVPEGMLPHVFKRFATDAPAGAGFGLGLYIARQIARAHGGDVTVDRYLGKGACFTLRLPLYS